MARDERSRTPSSRRRRRCAPFGIAAALSLGERVPGDHRGGCGRGAGKSRRVEGRRLNDSVHLATRPGLTYGYAAPIEASYLSGLSLGKYLPIFSKSPALLGQVQELRNGAPSSPPGDE